MKITAQRKLLGISYPIARWDGAGEPRTPEREPLAHSKKSLFRSIPHRAVVSDVDGILEFIEHWRTRRHETRLRDGRPRGQGRRARAPRRFGATAKAPRWAWPTSRPEQATRRARHRVQVGRTGALTPVAELEPVPFAGHARPPRDPPQPRGPGAEGCPGRRHGARREGRRGDPQGRARDGRPPPRGARAVRDAGRLPGLRRDARAARGRGRGAATIRPVRRWWRRRSGTLCRGTRWTSPAWGRRWWSSSSRRASDTSPALYALTPRSARRSSAGREVGREPLPESSMRKRPLPRLLFALGIRHVGERIAKLLARAFGTLEPALARGGRGGAPRGGPRSGPRSRPACSSIFSRIHDSRKSAWRRPWPPAGVDSAADSGRREKGGAARREDVRPHRQPRGARGRRPRAALEERARR